MLSECFDLIRKLENPVPANDRRKYNIKNVGNDGFMKIKNDLFHVKPYGKYYDSEAEWFELKITDVMTGNSTFIEWEEDDELEVYLTTKELKFSQLYDDESEEIDETDLQQIVRDEDDIFYKNKKFEFDDSYKAKYVRARDGKEFNVKFYDFEASDGECITIENWSQNEDRKDFEIWLSREAKKIEIISLGK